MISLPRIFLTITITSNLLFCSTTKDSLETIFSENEKYTIDRIIAFYDSFVQSHSKNAESIDDAYRNFLKDNVPKVHEFGDLGFLLPERKEQIKFYESLDSVVLEEIFYVQDSVIRFNKDTKEFIKMYHPFSFSLNTKGKYMKLLKSLAARNQFYKDYYESAKDCGDLCPSNYGAILTNFEQINFKKKEERLVVIVNLLHVEYQ